MKAYVLHKIGDFRLETVSDPVPKENEVIVAVKAAGICGSDISRVYQSGTYSYPLIPGHEFAGEVAELGAGVDASWKNRRVGVFPLIPCGVCAPCQKKQYEMCRNYGYLGSRSAGGFAEYEAVPAENLIALPDEVSYEAAAMLEPMAVAVHSMRRIEPKQNEKIVVCGLGTIGMFLVMFLREAGMEQIFTIGNKEFQKQIVTRMGISSDQYYDSKQQNGDEWLKEQTGGLGADVFFECVGKEDTFAQAIGNAAPAGRVMAVGNPASDMGLNRNTYWKILRNQLTVMGTWNSSFTHDLEDDWHYVLKRLKEGKIRPEEMISHRLPFDRLEEGFHIMRDKTEDYGKVMGKMEGLV